MRVMAVARWRFPLTKLPVITCLACCIDRELYKAIDYLREQVRVLVEQQENQGNRTRLTNRQRMRVAAKA